MDLIWTAGRVPVGADGDIPNDFGEQVSVTLDNLERTLRHLGGSSARACAALARGSKARTTRSP